MKVNPDIQVMPKCAKDNNFELFLKKNKGPDSINKQSEETSIKNTAISKDEKRSVMENYKEYI